MKRYFKIHEVVCPHVFEEFGEGAWRFFDPRLLRVIGWLRETINRPVFANSYIGGLMQRGLRCNLCSLVRDRTNKEELYMSAHVLGAALDFTVEGMSAEEARDWIFVRALDLPYYIRLEWNISWVHLDVLTEGPDIITYFPQSI